MRGFLRCLGAVLAISLIGLAIVIIAICAPEIIPIGLAAGIALTSAGGLGTLVSAIGLFKGENPEASMGKGLSVPLLGTP